MKCKICNNQTKKAFTSKILGKYNIDYFKCYNCGFIQTEKPFWLKEAYENSITTEDTGLIDRNIYFSNILPTIINYFFDKSANFLDYAGGYGIFTSLMRNKRFNFYTTDKYTKNILAKGFEYKKEIIKAITCFECFEHFEDPLKEIEKMLKLSNNIIFSTRLTSKEIPEKNWDYFGFNHGQHISFYSKKTLKYIAKAYNLNLYSNQNLHVLTKQKLNSLIFTTIINTVKLKNKIGNKILTFQPL